MVTLFACVLKNKMSSLNYTLFQKKLKYWDFLECAVCDKYEEICMTIQYKNYSSNLGVQQTLERVVEKLDIKPSTELVNYKNWIEV